MGYPADSRTGLVDGRAGEMSVQQPRFMWLGVEKSLVVNIGGIIMVAATLMSWREPGLENSPGLVGAGPVSGGAGLIVLASGLSFLLRPSRPGVVLGRALAGLVAVLIFIVRIETAPVYEFDVAPGGWIALSGAAIALIGSALLLPDSNLRPGQRIEWLPAQVGATMAVVAPLFLPWAGLVQGSALQPDFPPFEILADGLNTNIVTGYPILILGSAVLLIATLARVKGGNTGGRQWFLIACQASGSAIALLAGMEIASKLMRGNAGNSEFRLLILSGPLVALAGGILLARSIRPDEAAKAPDRTFTPKTS